MSQLMVLASCCCQPLLLNSSCGSYPSSLRLIPRQCYNTGSDTRDLFTRTSTGKVQHFACLLCSPACSQSTPRTTTQLRVVLHGAHVVLLGGGFCFSVVIMLERGSVGCQYCLFWLLFPCYVYLSSPPTPGSVLFHLAFVSVA